MNTLVLLLNRRSNWSPEDWVSQQGGELGTGGQLMIERPSGWLSILRNERVLDEYDVQERATLAKMLTEPVPFLIEWKGSVLLEAFLKAAAQEENAVIDNDHGVMVPVREVLDIPLESWARAKEFP
jgi:hypothetical protein